MRRFQFMLESILTLRLEKEQEAEMALGRAMGKWNHINGRKSRCLALKKKHGSLIPATSEDLLQKDLYLSRLDQEIQAFNRELKNREPEIARLRAAYNKARSQREGLEKLKEKRKAEHRKEAEKFEAHSMDDLLNNMDRIKAFRE